MTRADLEALARQAAQLYGLDPQMYLRQIQAESNWNPRARSHAGAMGLAQLMPGTAGDLGVTDPYDPRQSLYGGARYMRQMLDMFGGDYAKAFAAYNWGPGNVQKMGMGAMPKETRDYVAKLGGGQAIPGEIPGSRSASVDVSPGGGAMSTDSSRGIPLPEAQTTMTEDEWLKQQMARLQAANPVNPYQMLGQMGLGILSTPTGTGGTLQGVARGIQQGLSNYSGPEQMSQLQMLQAENELYELAQKRREYRIKQEAQKRGQEARSMIARPFLDPNDPRYNPELGHAIAEDMITEQDLGGLLIPEQPGAPSYGKTAEPWQAGEWDDGTPKYKTVVYGDDGTMKEHTMPKGYEPKWGPGQQGDISRARKEAELDRTLFYDLVNETGTSLTAVQSGLNTTENLLSRMDNGEFSGTGPLVGQARDYMGDVGTAVLQAETVNQALLNLQITNLAPVTEKEIELIQKLYANINRTPEQNKAILREIIKARKTQRRALRKIREELRAGTSPAEIRLMMADFHIPDIDTSVGDAPDSVTQPDRAPYPTADEVVEEVLKNGY